MGLDAYIYLPKDARIRDVAKVMGLLMGLPPVWDGVSDARWITVDGTSAEGIKEIPECANIYVEAPKGEKLIDGKRIHFCMFHYELSGKYSNYSLLMPRSTAFWIAVGIGLCKFFGGAIDYNDCDEGGINRRFKRPRKNNAPEDGKPWDDFQKELETVKPLTKKDIEKAVKFSGYGE